MTDGQASIWLWNGGLWRKAAGDINGHFQVDVLSSEMPTEVATRRMVGAGLVIAGAHKLHWLALNPSAGNSEMELTDATAALAAVVFDHFDTDRDGHMMHLDPPMQFNTGIWLETFVALTSIIFGYV